MLRLERALISLECCSKERKIIGNRGFRMTKTMALYIRPIVLLYVSVFHKLAPDRQGGTTQIAMFKEMARGRTLGETESIRAYPNRERNGVAHHFASRGSMTRPLLTAAHRSASPNDWRCPKSLYDHSRTGSHRDRVGNPFACLAAPKEEPRIFIAGYMASLDACSGTRPISGPGGDSLSCSQLLSSFTAAWSVSHGHLTTVRQKTTHNTPSLDELR